MPPFPRTLFVGVTIELGCALVGDRWFILREGIYGRLRIIFLFCWLFLTRAVSKKTKRLLDLSGEKGQGFKGVSSWQSSRFFLLEKVISDPIAGYLLVKWKPMLAWERALTEGLVLILNFWGKERSRSHGLFNALHLIGLIANQTRSDRIVALLDCARAGDRHVEHWTIICAKTLLFCLV